MQKEMRESEMHNPGNVKPYLKLWAILSIDKNGNEGICGINTPIGPQIAVTGEKRILDIYLEQVHSGQAKKELVEAGMKIVVAEYTRSNTTEPLEGK